jgi:hypothetical protein
MRKNPFDSFDKPSEYLPDGDDESKFIQNINNRIQKESKIKNIIPLRWMVGVAACLFLVSFYFLLSPTKLEKAQLSEAFFVPYKNYQFEPTRGADKQIDIKLAYDAYDEEDYAQSVKLFESFSDRLTPLDHLYYAISLQGNSQWVKSQKVLFEIENKVPLEHKDAWKYYISLSLIASDQSPKSIELLERLSKDESPFTKNAEKLIMKMKR